MAKIKVNGPHARGTWSTLAVKAGTPGARGGHIAQCGVCGYQMSTSLSAREADKLAAAHVVYMTKEGR